MTFRGLTWDHPRGYDALAAAEKQINKLRNKTLIHWDKQPLEGFESAPIADLANRYDLIVLDHPHIGEAAAKDCLTPLEDLFSYSQLEIWENQSIGPALSSYKWEGKTYALPLDVATQVMVRNKAKLHAAPTSWSEIIELADQVTIAQSLAGPHAFLTLISMAGGYGHWPKNAELLPDETAMTSLETMAKLYEKRQEGSELLNPIQLLECISQTNEISIIPLVFGYVTYAAANRTIPLTFSDTLCETGGAGGVLGGTGIGFSKRCQPSPELLDHIIWLMQPETQTSFIPAHGGQPSASSAWQDVKVNSDWNGFYTDVAVTAERALIRPRFNGFVAFQTKAAQIIRNGLQSREEPYITLSHIRTEWQIARAAAGGYLDDERGPSS